MTRKIHILGGGTVQFVRNHLALCAPAYGTTARQLAATLQEQGASQDVVLHLTKMTGQQTTLETNDDVQALLMVILANPQTRAIVFNVALCDFTGQVGDVPSGKYATRLHSREGEQGMRLQPADKLMGLVKRMRPDVFLVGFKTTAGASLEEQAQAARRQISETTADLVWANDTVTRANFLTHAATPFATPRPSPREALVDELACILQELQ